jgi:tight adherence protein C
LASGVVGPPGGGQPVHPAFALPQASHLDQLVSQRLKQDEAKNQLRDRLIQAGLYRQDAPAVFLIVRVLLLVFMVAAGFVVGIMGVISLPVALLATGFVGIAATIAPSFWLDWVKASRQRKIRRALPDALDVIGVCLQGGLSLPAALVRVSRELGTAHPMLALELAIVEREVHMGHTTAQALRRFSQRFDLEELRSLASVVAQAEKFGSSLTRAMSVYADTLRLGRHQRGEEMAQKAAIKLLFPTLFCILPGVFVVILGPAAIRIYETLIASGALRHIGG